MCRTGQANCELQRSSRGHPARSLHVLVCCIRAKAGKCVSVLLETVAVSSLLFMSSMCKIRSSPLLTSPPDDVCHEERSSRFNRACSRPLSQCAIVPASFLFLIQAASVFFVREPRQVSVRFSDAIDGAASHILAEVTRLLPSLVEKSTLAPLFLFCVLELRAAPTVAPCETPLH